MKKTLKILAIYVFFLPFISDIIGFFFEHSKIKYISKYPFSYIFETLFSGGTLIIPFLVLFGLAYINLFRKKPDDKYIYSNTIAAISTSIFIVIGSTLIITICFLYNYLGIHLGYWTKISLYGFIPKISIISVLIVYGLGFFIGWLINRYKIKK